MDYKSVLEEQVRELQKIQDSNVKNYDVKNVCLVSHEILEIVKELKKI